MNISDIVCVCFGMTANVITFFLGVAVGVSLVRMNTGKDVGHGNRYEDEGFQYHRNRQA